ncbi:MAG TPA: pilus assembly PilX N-terminal domain-containing protein, partial [Blastocatellia bacterium]|nr:pilus assembly PilX N-terminal domain-containing protein [Blastocatellia bacterium]
MALITALLSTTIMLALGMALIFSASTDTTTTKIQRVGQQAFFAADAGIGIARRALTQAFSEQIDKLRLASNQTGYIPFYKKVLPAPTGQFPDAQAVPPPDGTWTNSFYSVMRDRAKAIAAADTNTVKMSQDSGSSFTVEYTAPTGTVNVQKLDQFNAIETVSLRYSIKIVGTTSGGGSATVHESGILATTLTLEADGKSSRNFKFSGFGAFFDNGDTQASAPLANGTFSGPVHTNTHFAFLSNRSVTFRNVVSQVDSKIRYDDTGSTNPNKTIPPPSLTGITLSSEGYKTTTAVPLPENNFSQEYAVINSTGITEKKTDGTPVDPPRSWVNDSTGVVTIPTDGHGNPVPVFDSTGRVDIDVLAANLRTAKNQPATKSGGDLVDGVYISANDTAVRGAGIYVEGDVTDMQLYSDNGDQYYVIKQGTKTTTIRTDYTNSRTIISDSDGNSKTYTGVFQDR